MKTFEQKKLKNIISFKLKCERYILKTILRLEKLLCKLQLQILSAKFKTK